MSIVKSSDGGYRRLPLVAAFWIFLVAGGGLAAYENDPYTGRCQPIADSTQELDARVNEALERAAERWRGVPDDLRFAHKIYWRLGGPHWVDRIERWAIRSREIEKLGQERSIYRGGPLSGLRVTFFFGVGKTLRLSGVLVGSDKLGHFFSQGYRYYARHRRGKPEDEILRQGRRHETWVFGTISTGVFSNADLVANYEGYLFYRSLFEDGVVPGKPAVVAWRGGRPVLQRPFTWRDHVNDYWDEALNPSFFVPALQRYMDQVLAGLCNEYRHRPGLVTIRDDDGLRRRYSRLGLRDASYNRLDKICGAAPAREPAIAVARGRPSPDGPESR